MDTLSTLGLVINLITGLFEDHGAPAVRAQVVAPKVVEQAVKFRVDPFLVAAIITVENPRLIPNARSTVNAIGLMQVMPFWTISSFTQTCGYDPQRDRTNICMGIQVLQFHVDKAPTMQQALLDYNGCKRTPGCERYSDLVTQRRDRLHQAYLGQRWGFQAHRRNPFYDTPPRHDVDEGILFMLPTMLWACKTSAPGWCNPTGAALVRRRTLGCAPPHQRASLADPSCQGGVVHTRSIN